MKEVVNNKRENTNKLHEAIKKEYWRLYNKKKDGVRMYSTEYILKLVSEKFFKSKATVEKIVNNWV